MPPAGVRCRLMGSDRRPARVIGHTAAPSTRGCFVSPLPLRGSPVLSQSPLLFTQCPQPLDPGFPVADALRALGGGILGAGVRIAAVRFAEILESGDSELIARLFPEADC